MSYMQQGLGLDLEGAIKTIDAAAAIVKDPALPEVACNVVRLNKAVEGKPPGQSCPRRSYTPAQKAQGVGLHLAVTPLRAAVWARENPVLAIMAGAGVVGGLVGLGYWLGSGQR